MKLVNSLLIFILYALRPLNHFILGPSCCKFAISCTEHALEQLRQKPLNHALWEIGKRILYCNPFSSL